MNEILLEFAGRMSDQGATQLPESYKSLAVNAALFKGGSKELGEVSDFRLNMKKGRVTFYGADNSVKSGDVQIIGTLSDDGSFMWAWGHPDVPEKLQAAAWAVQQFGDRQEIEELLTRGGDFARSKVDELCAICAYISNADGVFLGDHGQGGQVAMCYYFNKQLEGLI